MIFAADEFGTCSLFLLITSLLLIIAIPDYVVLPSISPSGSKSSSNPLLLPYPYLTTLSLPSSSPSLRLVKGDELQ